MCSSCVVHCVLYHQCYKLFCEPVSGVYLLCKTVHVNLCVLCLYCLVVTLTVLSADLCSYVRCSSISFYFIPRSLTLVFRKPSADSQKCLTLFVIEIELI